MNRKMYIHNKVLMNKINSKMYNKNKVLMKKFNRKMFNKNKVLVKKINNFQIIILSLMMRLILKINIKKLSPN